MRLLPHDSDLGWTPFAWLIYILPFTLTPLWDERQANANGWTIYSIATLAFLVLYFRGFWARGRELFLVAASMAALAIAFWPLSQGAGALFIYAAATIANHERSRVAAAGVGIVAVIAFLEAVLLRRDLFSALWPIVFVVLIGGMNIHFAQVGRSNARLRLAHDEIEHLAKVAERERIARDLHDLLGHTLSLVVLKSELAAKIAERDPARAREEIRDVERIARDALTQVRAAVTGYRGGGFQSELEHAGNALATAGVEVETSVIAGPMPPAHEAVLALALREAVTNIVRHAKARTCKVALEVLDGACVLTVSDDGRGGNAPSGSGLSGMRERVEALGGSLSRDGSHGTTLVVRLPGHIPATEERSA